MYTYSIKLWESFFSMPSSPSGQDQRGVDALIQGSQQKVKKMSLLSDRQVKLWKVMLAGLFVAGFVAAIAFAVGTKVGRETIPQQKSEAAGLPVTVELLASPAEIQAGQSTTLSWSSVSAFKCKASGGWSGEKPTNGFETVTPGQSTTYSIICRGVKGTEASSGSVGSSSTVVTVVNNLPPSIPVVSVCPWNGAGTKTASGKCADQVLGKGCSLEVYAFDAAQKSAKIQCAGGAMPCTDWTKCVSPVQPDGLTYLAYTVHDAGGFLRWNNAPTHSSLAVFFRGGGGNGFIDEWTDYPNDATDLPGLVKDRGMRIVGVSWAAIGDSMEYGGNDPARWIRADSSATTFAKLAERPNTLILWIDDNLNPGKSPLALLGSSGGSQEVTLALSEPDIASRVSYAALVSMAPLTDLYHNCTHSTPSGTYVDPATGSLTSKPNDAAATIVNASGNPVPAGLPDSVWQVKGTQPGCLNKFNGQPASSVLSLTRDSSVADILQDKLNQGHAGFTGVAHFIVNNGKSTGGYNDDTIGVTWSAGNTMSHPFFKGATKLWYQCKELEHGGSLANPSNTKPVPNKCFDQIYSAMVNALGI